MAEHVIPEERPAQKQKVLGLDWHESYPEDIGGYRDVDMEEQPIIPQENVFFPIPDGAGNVPQIMNSAVAACNDSAENPHQCLAFYLSALACIFPGMRTLGVQMLAEMGFQAVPVREAQFEANGIERLGWINTSIMLATFGQLSLIPFKNITEAGYVNSFQARTNAIKAEAGVLEEMNPEGGNDVLLDIEVAKIIRGFMAGSTRIKAGLLKMMVRKRRGEARINRVCSYCTGILAWNDMAYMSFMFETLCLPNSPVLAFPKLQHEAVNLFRAYNIIMEADFPQYYRILNPTDASVTIQRAKFPTLIEVARRIKLGTTESVGNFKAATTSDNDRLVRTLVTLHTNYINQLPAVQMPTVLNFLTGIEPEGSEFRRNERGGAVTTNPAVIPVAVQRNNA